MHGILSFIDDAWAQPVNTGLILLLAIWQARTSSKARAAEESARDAKRLVGANNRDKQLTDTRKRRRIND